MIQVSALQVVKLYAAERQRCRQKQWCEDYQRVVNRLGMVVTEMLRSALAEMVVREIGFCPAVLLPNNRRQRYGLRLLGALMTQPTKNILPVTLRETEEHAQSEKQQEDEFVWKKPSRARWEGL